MTAKGGNKTESITRQMLIKRYFNFMFKIKVQIMIKNLNVKLADLISKNVILQLRVN